MAAREFGESRWAVVAGLILLLLAVPIGGLGIVLIAQGVNYDDPGGAAMGYGTLAMVIGAVVVGIGIIHAASSIYISRHHAWARYAGVVIAVLAQPDVDPHRAERYPLLDRSCRTSAGRTPLQPAVGDRSHGALDAQWDSQPSA